MNVLIVDTSAWISYFSGKGHSAIDPALEEGRVHLPPLVAGELLSGKMVSQQREKLIDFLRELPLCENTLDHWIRVGALRSELLKKGFAISTPDAHIVQSALDIDGYLVSEDKIFSKIQSKLKLKLI